jgi:hypothetical protein
MSKKEKPSDIVLTGFLALVFMFVLTITSSLAINNSPKEVRDSLQEKYLLDRGHLLKL